MNIFRIGFRSLTIVSLGVFLVSCAGARRLQEDIINSREKDKKGFVVKTNGEIVEGNDVKIHRPLFGKSTAEVNGVKEAIPLKEVEAYQDAYAYHHDTPDGFAVRIKKGLVNVYMGTTTYSEYDAPMAGPNAGSGMWRQKTRQTYYIQKGNSGKIESFRPGTIESYVSDYAPAMDFMNDFNATQKKVSRWSIINTVATFGGLALVAADRSDKTTAVGYGGIGLFVGGIVNGIVNKIRRVKNHKNLELAIDTYNGQVTKKRRQ